jgi:hypothetical protein
MDGPQLNSHISNEVPPLTRHHQAVQHDISNGCTWPSRQHLYAFRERPVAEATLAVSFQAAGCQIQKT